ncbi:class I SAM-dependent methyltransferase [Actinopolyspora erythraea]|uniref:Methyltransferase n=1 Tax=Actinopolyspora erythraea TaxID=414996 RepID=A0A099D3Y1_9ACTN|nr:class I SAM-dependent methyltransferase [Actinopolyspora erythraea]ASU79245.1 class I SAM-dependent methyltransferase [Actinopolyspora erythraea]KGI80779.1 methyltransferase [Actinopolyspora erythraea]
MTEEFDRAFWEERYRRHRGSGAGEPNPHLVAEVGELAPGSALDVGCGEGAEAMWLASRGWRVTATDIAASALERARRHAEILGDGVADRIEWVRTDLTGKSAWERCFDLVTAHYVHPAGSPEEMLASLAAAVAPGGTLFVVGHHPSDQRHASSAEAYVAAERLAAELTPERWEVVVAETRSRPAGGHHGHGTTLWDSVLRARRRA